MSLNEKLKGLIFYLFFLILLDGSYDRILEGGKIETVFILYKITKQIKIILFKFFFFKHEKLTTARKPSISAM